MIAVEIDTTQLQQLAAATRAAGKSFTGQLRAAINEVSKKAKLDMGRIVRDHVLLSKKTSEEDISLSVDMASMQAVLRLGKYRGTKSGRLGLRHYKAKQDKRGVSYRISKFEAKKRIEGAFQGPKPGVVKMSWKGNVFVRQGAKRIASKGRHQGKQRQPIVQKMGVSPLGVYLKNDLAGPQAMAISAILRDKLARRINQNILRAKGLIK